jgi:hypothetical protein
MHKNWKRIASWRSTVIQRDGAKCRDCGSTERIEAHHIIPKSYCLATAFLPMNGVALCRKCHQKTDNYGSRGIAKEKFTPYGFSCITMTIPHRWQVYPTVGNWAWAEDGFLVIFVSEMGNPDYEFLVGIHEQTEAWLCQKRGIAEDDVTAFDLQFERERELFLHSPEAEPGDDPRAPYRREHMFATCIEQQLAKELGVNWKIYDDTVTNL